MRATELKEKTLSEVKELEKNLTAEAFKLKFQLATEQLSNSAKLVATRRDLARVKTVLREAELGIYSAPGTSPAVDEEE